MSPEQSRTSPESMFTGWMTFKAFFLLLSSVAHFFFSCNSLAALSNQIPKGSGDQMEAQRTIPTIQVLFP